MVPGLTKVLMVAQDFPMLNLAPTSKTLRDARKMNIIHQACHVFVFDSDEEDRETNGTLKLVAAMNEYEAPDFARMHAIRKEFLKKVLVGYIKTIPIEDESEHQEFNPFIAEEDFGIKSKAEWDDYQEKVLSNMDEMDSMLVFKMYQSLVFDLKDQLRRNKLLSVQETDKNMVNTTIVQGFVRFVKSGDFLKQPGSKKVKTSP